MAGHLTSRTQTARISPRNTLSTVHIRTNKKMDDWVKHRSPEPPKLDTVVHESVTPILPQDGQRWRQEDSQKFTVHQAWYAHKRPCFK